MAELTLTPVRGAAEARAFLALPHQIYRRDACWVAPLRSVERDRWSPRANASLAGRFVERWIARRGRRVVGRIAAIIDPGFARWESGTGFFGFFECEDDAAAARALLAAAESWLAEAGVRRVLGPVNLTTHDEVGLLVAGYGSPPTLLAPYNPEYYPGLVEAAGYGAARDYIGYRWTPACAPGPALVRALRRHASAPVVQLRSFDPARWDAEVAALLEVYNEAFADLWGFVPIARAELERRAREFRAFYRPELIAIAESAGQVVGFALLLPDVNVALRPLRGRLLPFGWLRLWRGVPRLRTGRFLLLGVRPAYAGRGIAALLAHAVDQAGRRLGITSAELALVQADNAPMRHVIEAFGCEPVKRYRLYAKNVSA